MLAKPVSVYFRSISLLALSLVLLSMASCKAQYVADHDVSIQNEIIRIAKRVDLFWASLLDKPANRRDYDSSKQDYLEIESELRSLVFQNEIRYQNTEITKQANNALDLWLKNKALHKKSNRVEDFEAELHRQKLLNIFTAMARGEALKKISPVGVSNPGPTP